MNAAAAGGKNTNTSTERSGKVLFTAAPTVRKKPSSDFVRRLRKAGADPDLIRVVQGRQKRPAH